MTDYSASPAPSPGCSFKVRSPIAVVLLIIVTLGIYGLYWFYQLGREMKEYNDSGLGPVVNLLLAIFIGFVLWFTIPNDVKATYESAGKQTDISALTGLWNFLPLIGSIIWIVKVQSRLNALWEESA